MTFGPLEIGLLALVVLLLFGAPRLPEIGRQLGRAVRNLRGGGPPDAPG